MNDDIKQDINFLEYPLWMQQPQKATGQIVKWEDQDGYLFEAAGGVPSKVDMLFLYYLMLEAQNNNWDKTLILSRYQILKGCGMNPSKNKRNRLKQSLEIWKRVTIAFSGTFYLGKEYHDMEFGIIEYWGVRKKDNKLEVRLSAEWIEKIKQSEFFKYVSFSQMKALRSPLAFRLYEILVKTFCGRKIWEIDVFKLATKIPMTEKYFSDITPKITAATKRISDKTDLNVKIQVVKQGRGKGKFIFSKIAKQKPKSQIPLSPKKADDLPDIPVELLDMIPLPDRVACTDLCQKIFTGDGADGLRFYIEKTNNRKQNGKSSYSGYLKTVFDLNLYADYLASKQAQKKQERAEQAKIQEKLKKEQEDNVGRREQLTRQEALKQLEQDQPEKYQQLYDQAARDLDINSGRLKRGDNLKIIFKMTERMS